MIRSGFHNRLLLSISVLLLTVFTLAGSGCRILQRDKQSVAEKKQKKADEKASAEYSKARDQHFKNQSKDAKKMMKRTKKQAAKFNKPLQRKRFSKTKCY